MNIFSYIKKGILGITLLGVGFLGYSFGQEAGYGGNDYCTQGDLMQQAFCMANRQDLLIDLGNTKTAVGNEAIKGATEVDISLSGVDINKKGSTIIRITQFLLMLTIVLSVTMIIFNGIQYITKSGSGEDPSKATKNLILIVVGIIIALSSVMIINLLRSIGESTLEEFTYYAPNHLTTLV